MRNLCELMQLFKGRWTYHPDDNTGLITIGGSRALIEESIRARLLALWPNVRIVCGCRAVAPIWSPDFSCMEGTLLPKQCWCFPTHVHHQKLRQCVQESSMGRACCCANCGTAQPIQLAAYDTLHDEEQLLSGGCIQ